MFNKLCVDIGSSNIKIVYGNNFLGKPVINKSEILDTPLNSFSNGYINSEERIAEKIKEFIIKNKLKAPQISFVVHSSDIIIRNIKLPIMSGSNIIKSIEWEMGSFTKGAITDYYIGYEIVGKVNVKKNKVMKVFFVIVPKRIINQYESLAKLIGAQVKCIEIASICAARFLNRHSSSYFIMDLGYESVRISLYENDFIFADRELLLKKPNNLEGNSIKRNHSSDNFSVNSIPNKNLEIILENLSQMTNYYLSIDSNHSISGIYTSGGLAYDTRICEIVGNTAIAYQNSITDYKQIKADDKLNQKINIFANAIGLLLRK